MDHAEELTDWDTQVAAADGAVLVDFHASWCGPCRTLAPIVDQLAAAHPDQLEVITVDIDQHPDIAHANNVMSVPTLVLYRNGKPVHRSVGVKPIAELQAAVRPHLGP